MVSISGQVMPTTAMPPMAPAASTRKSRRVPACSDELSEGVAASAMVGPFGLPDGIAGENLESSNSHDTLAAAAASGDRVSTGRWQGQDGKNMAAAIVVTASG